MVSISQSSRFPNLTSQFTGSTSDQSLSPKRKKTFHVPHVKESHICRCSSSDLNSYRQSNSSKITSRSNILNTVSPKAWALLIKGIKSRKFDKILKRKDDFENKTKLTPTGKVGVCGRYGNASMASFGLQTSNLRVENQRTDLAKILAGLLPYVVVLTALSALIEPKTFTWFTKDYFAPALGGIMLSIGIQLSPSDFVLVLKRPLPVLIGILSQYCLKPLLALLVVSIFQVPVEFSAGLLLTASVAGAQLASYAAYLANADVALSIVLTSLTTMISVAATPLLSQLLIGSVVPVDAVAMSKSILQVVIFPVFMGLVLNTYCKSLVDKIRPIMPIVAIVCTSLCVGAPLAANRSHLICPQGLLLLLPVAAFHFLSFAGGYSLSKLPFWRQDEKTASTLSLCTGMQSSTLAMLLASQFLGASQSVPPAVSVVIMAVSGLSLGSFWGKGGKLSKLFQFMFSLPSLGFQSSFA